MHDERVSGTAVAAPLEGVADAYALAVGTLEDVSVSMLDPDGVVRSWNLGAERLDGYLPAEIVGRDVEALSTDEAVDSGHPRRVLGFARSFGRHEEETWLVRQDGRRYWGHVVLTAMHEPGGAIVGFVRVARDLTDRRLAEDQTQNTLALLQATARTDLLTGLLNRMAWDDRLEAETAAAHRSGRPMCVAVVDVDHFKSLNDTDGHQAGDRFLRAASDAWRAVVRRSDVLGRIGGEEFALVLPECDLTSALAVADRVRLATPPARTTSVGVAELREGERSESVVERADRALFRAKSAGRNRTAAASQAL